MVLSGNHCDKTQYPSFKRILRGALFYMESNEINGDLSLIVAYCVRN